MRLKKHLPCLVRTGWIFRIGEEAFRRLKMEDQDPHQNQKKRIDEELSLLRCWIWNLNLPVLDFVLPSPHLATKQQRRS